MLPALAALAALPVVAQESVASTSAGDTTLTLTLTECRQMALAASEDIKTAANDRRKAELDEKIAKLQMAPGIDGQAMVLAMFPNIDMGGGSEVQMKGTWLAGISLSQPLYAGGQIAAGKRLAKIGVACQEEQNRLTRMDVLCQADRAYWTLLSVQSKVTMLESVMAQIDTAYRQTQIAVRAGMATDNDLLRVEAKRSEMLYNLQKARNGCDLCRLSLCQVTGQGWDTQFVIADTLAELPAPGELAQGIEDRPEVHLLEQQVKATEQQVKLTRGDHLPVIGLSAGYTRYGGIKMKGVAQLPDGSSMPYTNEMKDGMGYVMAALKIPVFKWGAGKKDIQKSRIEHESAQLTLEKNTRLLEIEQQQAIRNVQDGYLMVETAQRGVAQATENLRIYNKRYAAKMSTLSDLLDAQTQWQQAASNLIEAQTQYKIYQSEYLKASGRLE